MRINRRPAMAMAVLLGAVAGWTSPAAAASCPDYVKVERDGALVDEPLAGVAAPPPLGMRYMIYVNGMCSTWASTASDSDHVTVMSCVDQRDSMGTALADFVDVLDHFCPADGDHPCDLYVYSNGGAVASKALSSFPGRWQVHTIFANASNEGGSRLSAVGKCAWWQWIITPGTCLIGAAIRGIAAKKACPIALKISPSEHRSWNHDQTGGATVLMAGGNDPGNLWFTSLILHLPNDGVVDVCSSGGMREEENDSAYRYLDFCTVQSRSTSVTQHYPAWEPGGPNVPNPQRWDNHFVVDCDGFPRNHDGAWGLQVGSTTWCGNGVIDAGEDCGHCPEDTGQCMGFCGDGQCLAAQREYTNTCPLDCGAACNDGYCHESERSCDAEGNCTILCPSDCPASCGDGLCDDQGQPGGETFAGCVEDCPYPLLEDGVCEVSIDREYTELCSVSYYDCGACDPVCGNGVCEPGETTACAAGDCPADPCAPVHYGDVRIVAGSSGTITCQGGDIAIRKAPPGTVETRAVTGFRIVGY